VAKLTEQTNSNAVIRDVAKHPVSHLTQDEMNAWITPAQDRTDEQQALSRTSDLMIEELQKSDTIVIAMPMYNFGVPSTFKAWVDRVARAGITFNYTENGPVGLLKDKKVIIVATRGGIYEGTEKDSQSQFLKDFFSFIGLDDIKFIYAEGLNMPDGDLNFKSAQSDIANFKI
jgi:FMN-dependent NADH-azoreductase